MRRKGSVENINYQGIRQLGWISLDETLTSRTELALQSFAFHEWFPCGSSAVLILIKAVMKNFDLTYYIEC